MHFPQRKASNRFKPPEKQQLKRIFCSFSVKSDLKNWGKRAVGVYESYIQNYSPYQLILYYFRE